MVYFQAYSLVILGVILSLVENGFALRCWKCSSDYDSTCRDYFNTTRIRMNTNNLNSYNYGALQPARTDPHLTDCEGMHTSTFGKVKNVCLKRVISVENAPDHVIRECRMVSSDLKVGACPEELLYSTHKRHVEYCGTCETEDCNSAPRNSLVFAGLVPAVILLLGR